MVRQTKRDSGVKPVDYRRSIAVGLVVALAALFAAGCNTDPRAAARAYTASGRHYLDQKKFSEAAIEFRNALQRDSSNWQARYGLAQAELQLRQWRGYYRDLKAVVETQPTFVPARLALAELYLQAQQIGLAQEQIDQVRKLDPKSVGAEMAEMKLYLSNHQEADAASQCAKIRQMASAQASVYGLCGLAAIGSRNYAAAEADFRQAVALEPDSADNDRNLANALELEGHASQAEALLRSAALNHPKSLDIQMVLADFYVRHGRSQEADQLFASLQARPKDFTDLAVTLGDFWMSRNELTRAAAEYQRAEAAKPTAVVEKNLASCFLTLHQIAEAEGYTRKVLARDAKDPDGHALDGALAYFQGDYAKASQELTSALNDNPDSILAKFYLGLTYSATGQIERAKGAFTDCVRMNDKFTAAYLRLGDLALESNDWRLGAEYARKVLAINPGSLEGYLLLAQADMIQGDLKAAGQVIAAGEKLPQPSPQFRQVAVRYDVLRKDFSAADTEFDLAAARTPDSFPLMRWYASQLVAAGQTAHAVERLQKWMAQVRPSAAADEFLGQLYLRQDDLDHAEDSVHQALALDKGSATAHQLLGQILEQRERFSDASAEYAAAIQANATDARSYLLAGDLKMRQGQYEQAQSYYESARVQSPDSAAAKLALARCWGERDLNLDQALGFAQELKTRFPDNPRVADTLGWIYHQKGLNQLALAQLQAAARNLPQDGSVQFHLGMSLLGQDGKVAAHAALDRALKLGLPAPQQAAAEKALASMEHAENR